MSPLVLRIVISVLLLNIAGCANWINLCQRISQDHTNALNNMPSNLLAPHSDKETNHSGQWRGSGVARTGSPGTNQESTVIVVNAL